MMNILCVLKTGGDFNKGYVEALYNSCKRNVRIPFEFICLTDDYEYACSLRDLSFIRLSKEYSGWWSKIELFKSVGKNVYIDLDTVILSDITDLVSYSSFLKDNEFIGLKAFHPERAKHENTNFNSGIMAWNGNFSYILNEFEYEKEKNNYPLSILGAVGDQGYITKKLRERNINIQFWQDKFSGIYSYRRHCREQLPKDTRIVCFHGHPRPHEVKNLNWMEENWK